VEHELEWRLSRRLLLEIENDGAHVPHPPRPVTSRKPII
jgi:hypothetical protein